MEPDRAAGAAGREVRIEGLGLAAAVGGVVLLVILAFAAGTCVGRRAAPPSADRAAGGSEAAGEGPVVETRSDYFDRTDGAERQAEPRRETATPPPVLSPPKPAGPAGPWDVQVFAGRDRLAAQTLVRSLEARGYPVRIEGSRDGADTLLKVRVGGYPTEAEARAAAERLRREGETGAWVTRAR
jgi:cell division septation protein DedD